MPSPSTNSHQSNIVQELQDLLGSPVVFIAWPRGVKGSKRRWKHLRPADMTATHLAKLPRGNIGVALGKVSGGLCAIDIDNEDFVAPFEQANPWTANTMQTHGSRGRVYWVRFNGDYPAASNLKTQAGLAVGEFRGTGLQAIVWGIHPDTKSPYQRIRNLPVARISFAQVCWPAGVVPPPLQRGRVDEMKRGRVDDDVCSALAVLNSPPYQVNLVQCAHGDPLLTETVRAKVESFLPVGPGQNNKLLFELARRLKWLEGITPAILSEAFNLWHTQAAARGFLKKDESKDDYAGKFWDAIAKAKTPPQLFDAAVALAKSSPPPPEAEIFESPGGKLVAAVCYQLHLQTPEGENWYVPVRKAQDAVGIHWTRISGHLARLLGLGIIEMREPPRNAVDPKLRRSTRYVWKGLGIQN